MYNPCVECYSRYRREYSEWCDENCEYANAISKFNKCGGINEALKVMNGNAIPVKILDKEHIDYTYTVVKAAKDGII